ncbi:MAG: RNA-binding S4 domain-containing protein [Prevotellaceae bacterium]|jgi:ribosome-associated protein|nr:RNA-binding S4 domain-containing protein [Prevotellaceae bacterium]
MIFDFTLKGDYIELTGLLKVLNLASTGGEAKMLVDAGVVYLNGKQELRRRAKLKSGDKVELKTDDEYVIIHIK